MRNVLIYIVIIIFSAGCGGQELVRFYGPVPRGDVEIISGKGGLIKSLYFDVLFEHVQKSDWEYLASFKSLKGGGTGYPLEPCFHIMIINTWNRPFEVKKIELICDAVSAEPEYFDFSGDPGFPSERYAIDLSALWKKRRVLTHHELVADMDFKSGTVEYKLDFIAPGDKISSFYLFNSVPAGCKNIKLAVTIKYLDMEKVIDFDITSVIYSRKKWL